MKWEQRFIWCLKGITNVWNRHYPKNSWMFLMESLQTSTREWSSSIKVTTSDGLHPDCQTANRFWLKIYEHLRSICQEQASGMVDLPIPLSPSSSVSGDVIISEEIIYATSPPPFNLSYYLDSLPSVPSEVDVVGAGEESQRPCDAPSSAFRNFPPPLALVAPATDPTLPDFSLPSTTDIIIDSAIISARPGTCLTSPSVFEPPRRLVPVSPEPHCSLSYPTPSIPSILSSPKCNSKDPLTHIRKQVKHVTFSSPSAEKRERNILKLARKIRKAETKLRKLQKRHLRLIKRRLAHRAPYMVANDGEPSESISMSPSEYVSSSSTSSSD